MGSSDGWSVNTAYCTRRLDEYKETISQLFPALSRGYVDAWSISDIDALTLGLFLECYPRKVTVLDIGTFVGVSAFCFASQSKVLRVISVDPNPTIAYEINDKSEILGTHIAAESLGSLRVLDVAQAALAEFGNERDKIQLREGTVGSTQVGVKGEPLDSVKKLDILGADLSEGAGLVAFVDGLHTREGVQADLETIFSNHPHAVAILDDCRHTWGPFVQAGVVDFIETAQNKYHFQLLGDLSSSIATSNLGIVYPDVDSAEVQRSLAEFSELFSERLDLLRLLRREEELISIINSYKDTVASLRQQNRALAKRKSQLKQHNSQLKQHNSQLIVHHLSRRYKLADALAEKVLRVPGARELVRRKPSQ